MILKNTEDQPVPLGVLIKTNDGSRIDESDFDDVEAYVFTPEEDYPWTVGIGELSIDPITKVMSYVPTQEETNVDIFGVMINHSEAISPQIFSCRTMFSPVGSGSGGGVLNGRIAYSSLTPDEYLEIIQGEEKILTVIVEADGRFDSSQATSISVKFADPAGNVVSKSNSNITRVTEEQDIQVFRVTLETADTEILEEGLLQIEVSFDNQKSIITHNLKVVEAL